jgi:hypothetical protein
MPVAVLTPFTAGQAVELSNRTWIKKVLPVGEIDYKGRVLRFTKDYLAGLVRAFQDRAYDQVPFQLADAHNTHTNDPERYRGEIRDMLLRDDGLWVVAEVTPEGEQVLTANPRLGVSARIVEGYDRADGKFFNAAIQHVLGTLDPRIPNLGPWQAIEAANPVDEVLDLSNLYFAGEQPDPSPAGEPSGRTDDMNLSGLSDAQQERLNKLLNMPDEQFNALTGAGTADEQDSGLSEAELDELVAAAEALDAAGLLEDDDEQDDGYSYEQPPEPAAASLTADAQFEIALANARADENARQLAIINERMREQDYQAEKRRLADLGVPPHITELARPLLEGAGHAVELANGRTVDAGSIMRKVLSEYASQVRLLDLDVELGSPMDDPGEGAQEQAQERRSLVELVKNQTGLR